MLKTMVAMVPNDIVKNYIYQNVVLSLCRIRIIHYY